MLFNTFITIYKEARADDLTTDALIVLSSVQFSRGDLQKSLVRKQADLRNIFYTFPTEESGLAQTEYSPVALLSLLT